jgi:uncharacterized protein (DUF58 family)
MKFLRDSRLRLRTPGWVFIVIAVLVQLAAWNTGENLLYLVSGGLVSYIAVSLLLPVRMLSGLKVYRSAPASVYRDEPFAVTIRIENHKRLLPSLSLRVTSAADAKIQAQCGYVVKAPAQAAAVLRLSHALPRRGVHVLPPVTVASGFPFGLFERRRTFAAATEVVVYPRVNALRATTLEQMYGGGETPRLLRGDSDEFFCLRDYSPGDDLRRISWKISARLRKLVVREMEPSTSHNILIGVDTCRVPEMVDFDEQFENAVDLAASPDRSLELGEGTAQVRRVLDVLARIEPVSAHEYGPDWFDDFGDMGTMAYAYVSADSSRWGARVGLSGTRVLDPREVVHA